MRKCKIYRRSIIILSILFGLLATTSADAIEDFSGDWRGTWRSNTGAYGSDFYRLTQIGSSVSGTISSWGGSCPPNNAAISGNVTENVLSSETNYRCGGNNYRIEIEWILNDNHYSGTWTVYIEGSFKSAGTSAGKRSVNFINATAGTGGTIVPSGNVSVPAGTDQTFNILPDNGYKILDMVVDGVSIGAENSYTFYDLSANHTIMATFEAVPNPTGSIVPSILTPLLLNDE
jgi:hypothetical protein